MITVTSVSGSRGSYREREIIMSNVFGIDLGTCNLKVYSKHADQILKEKNTIASVNKNQMYAFGDDAGNYSGVFPCGNRCDRGL